MFYATVHISQLEATFNTDLCDQQNPLQPDMQLEPGLKAPSPKGSVRLACAGRATLVWRKHICNMC
jgi:hypothetical protein